MIQNIFKPNNLHRAPSITNKAESTNSDLNKLRKSRKVRFTIKRQSRLIHPKLPTYDTPRFMSKRRKIKCNYN